MTTQGIVCRFGSMLETDFRPLQRLSIGIIDLSAGFLVRFSAPMLEINYPFNNIDLQADWTSCDVHETRSPSTTRLGNESSSN